MTDGPPADGDVEHLDVVVVGAGISGFGAAYHLRRDHPQRSLALLEARGATGGTWDLFRYPGIRSDSDLHTFGYEFEPWQDEVSIADGDRILAYLRRTAARYDLDRHVRLHHRVVGADWSSARARWTVEVERTDTGARSTLTCSWLFCGSGYYRYDEGYTPDLPGLDDFAGPVVHPQHWPADLDLTDRQVLVVGSGATAVTIVPAVAGTAAHVTMLQRTPTYVLPTPSRDPVAGWLVRRFGPERGYRLARSRAIWQQRALYRLCRRRPRLARRLIRWVNVRQLPAGYPVDEHFSPPYDPWDQRLCAVPDGDLFRALRRGTASVVTDRIERFTPTGVRLASGRELPADVVVTATGLQAQAVGGIRLRVDGADVDLPRTVAYKGMMLSGVPNFAYAVGYTNSSWTLKVGLVCEHLCRLLAHLDVHGLTVARPEVADPTMPTRPLLDLKAGYVARAAGSLPRQGDRQPWLTSADYRADVRLLRRGPVTDPELHLSSPEAVRPPVPDPSADAAAR